MSLTVDVVDEVVRTTVLAFVVGACTFPRPPNVDGPVDAAVDARPELVTGTWVKTYVTDTQSTDEPFDGAPGFRVAPRRAA